MGADSGTHKENVRKDGVLVGRRGHVNFIEGSNVTITGTDDPTNDEIEITIAASDTSGAPATADYLVGTTQAGLSAEIVVGTTPGGELGGTWATPTVDATHSGSTHQAATTTHEAAGDPHTGYRLESADHTHQTTGAQAGQLDHGAALTGLTDDDHTQYLKEEASGGAASEVPDHTHASAAEAGGTLSPATLNLPAAASPAQTADGQAVWDSDGDFLTVGDGTGRQTFLPVIDATSDPAAVATSTAADGTEASVARKDHVHAHGTHTTDLHTNYVQESLIDAKGDLIAGTAADTVGRLAVGANDTVLTAASGEATGLKWAAASGGTDRATYGGWGDDSTTGTAVQMFRAFGIGAASVSAAAIPIVVDRAGSIVGVTAVALSALNSGSIAFEVYLNGSATGLSATITTQYAFAVQAAGLDTFVAGDQLDIRYTTSSPSFAGTIGYEAGVTVLFD